MVNLMDTSATNLDNEHVIVDVKDHDINVPSDLGGNGLPFWKQEEMKIWLYVLAGAVIILVTVFALLSKQTSLFQGKTRLDATVSIEDPEDTDLDGFNSQAADSEDNTGEDILDGEGDFATDPAETNNDPQADINDYLNNDEVVLDTATDNTPPATDYNDGLDALFGNNTDTLDTPEIGQDPFDNSDTLPVHEAASDDFDIQSEITDPLANDEAHNAGPNLDTNTDQEVLDSPDMQGDTGPAPLVAMIPAALYAIFNPKKKLN